MKKSTIYYIFILLLIIFIGVSSFFTFYFYKMFNTNISLNEITVSENQTISYSVKFNGSDNYVASNQEITNVTSDIDTVNTYFNYSVSFNDIVKGNYSYYIVGSIVVEDENGNNILTRQLKKTDLEKFNINKNVINLSSSFDIVVDEFESEFNEIKSEYDNNVIGTIKYDVIIDYSVYNDSIRKYISDKKVLSIEVPLNGDYTSIVTTPNESNQRKEISDTKISDDPLYLAIIFEFMGSILLFFILILYLIRKINHLKSPYEERKEKILNRYEGYLVSIETLPDLSDEEVLFVTSMKDLQDASDSLKLPINYIEVVEGKETVFIILAERNVYVYKLTNNS